jgi:hypothetical protein
MQERPVVTSSARGISGPGLNQTAVWHRQFTTEQLQRATTKEAALYTEPMLSTLWTVLVAIAAVFIGVLWFALSIERMGLASVVAFIAVALLVRQRQSAKQEPPASSPESGTSPSI